MTKLTVFFLLVLFGFITKDKILPLVSKEAIQKLAYYNLLILVFVQFWLSGIDLSLWYLVVLGFFIHLLPLAIGIVLRNSESGKYFIAFSTYGGGNRGILALTIIAPSYLPYFIIVDIGIFLSLLIFFPIAAGFLYGRKKTDAIFFSMSSLVPVLTTIGVVLLGVILNSVEFALFAQNTILDIVKLSLLIIVSIYLGINFDYSKLTLDRDIFFFFYCRLVGVLLPIATIGYLVIPEVHFSMFLGLLILCSILPVSSFAPQMVPQGSAREWMATQVVGTSGMYVVILVLVAITVKSVASQAH